MGESMEDKEYLKFIENIKRYIGIDLGLYKETQMNRRMRTLYEKRGFTSYDEYFLMLRKETTLLEEFLDRMTINVTEFFRNSTRWDVLRDKLIPELKTSKRKIRCWSAACSTGEEPYTLAMLLLENFPSHQIDIIATDIDDMVLEKAKEGIYTEALLKGCPEPFITRYFKKDEHGLYHIKEEVRRCITFKKHNMLHDRFEEDFDLIICRNVMIYFTEEAKEKLYYGFNQSLKEDGVLFVGSTEQIFHPETYNFEVYDAFFYKKVSK